MGPLEFAGQLSRLEGHVQRADAWATQRFRLFQNIDSVSFNFGAAFMLQFGVTLTWTRKHNLIERKVEIMALKTLDPNVKQAFAQAGVTLTPEQEHVAAQATAIDWLSLLKNLASVAAQVIPLIIGLLGGQTPPTPAPAQAGAHCPDHHCLCCETLKSAMKTAELAALHVCCCCCEHCH